MKSKAKTIRQDLLDQLSRNGTAGEYYNDLVGDYMSMWEAKNLLIKDIKARGVTVERLLADGRTSIAKNESVGELVKLNAQMLKLLDSIGLSPADGGAADDEPL